ncbi:HalOD1 output domain-containing protein [Natrinema salinisoli]|uniref:HalOD1 output domain-containing protein n=1 Tax=Natrinema salinisoli TaxID=2878535 RepID=UPI001CF06AAC|nr:HalOD1 output domain-containing protein [Natrinema salinisoli]
MQSSQNAIGAVEIVSSMDNVEFDVDEDTFRAEYDSSRDQPSLAVVAAVAGVSNTEPEELTPLHSVVNTSALNDLFSPTGNARQRNGCLSFSYEGFDVTVFGEGTVEVSPEGNA